MNPNLCEPSAWPSSCHVQPSWGNDGATTDGIVGGEMIVLQQNVLSKVIVASTHPRGKTGSRQMALVGGSISVLRKNPINRRDVVKSHIQHRNTSISILVFVFPTNVLQGFEDEFWPLLSVIPQEFPGISDKTCSIVWGLVYFCGF